ncbi:MAG TPA: MFS transporter [Solirubrobacteraceae bacterium]|nr:MFS transporter [Solirubrobacteraceae bacterium]
MRRHRFSSTGTLAVVCFATAMLMLDIAVVNTALPKVAADLHANLTGIQWIVDAYTLALAAVVLTAGSIADRIGRRLIFTTGMGIFTATSLACAIAPNIAVLDAARAVQGIGAAMMFASSLAILVDAFPTELGRTKAFAAYGATIGAAFAVGPLVGGALTSGITWRAVFYVNVPLGIAALAASYMWLRESRDPSPRAIDRIGQATLTGGLFLLILALLRGNHEGWGSALIVAELVGAGVLLALFVFTESRVQHPMLPLHLFRRSDFSGSQIAAFTVSASFFALFLYITLYLQEVLRLSPIQAGLVILPGTILMFAVSGATAQLMTRIRPGLLVVVGLVLVAVGLAMMTLDGVHSSWTALLPGEFVVCFGTGLINPALAAVAMGSVPEHQSGLAAGANDAFRQTGIAVGVAAFGALVPAAAAVGHGSAAAYVTGWHTAMFVGVGLAIVGALVTAALLIGRRTEVPTGDLVLDVA